MENMKSSVKEMLEKAGHALEKIKYTVALISILTLSSCGGKEGIPEGTVTSKSRAHDEALFQANKSKEAVQSLEQQLKEAKEEYKQDSLLEATTNQDMVNEAEKSKKGGTPCN